MKKRNNNFIQQLQAKREAAKAKSQPSQEEGAAAREADEDAVSRRPRFLPGKRRRPSWR